MSTGNFQHYENSTVGIKMDYPSDWETFSFGNSIVFTAPKPSDENVFPQQVGVLNLDPLPSTELSITKFFQKQYDEFRSTYPQYTIIEPASFGNLSNGNPALMAKFAYQENNIKYNALEIWTVNQDKTRSYQLEITGRADGETNNFPPEHMKRMVDSLQFLSAEPVQSISNPDTSDTRWPFETTTTTNASNTEIPSELPVTGNLQTYENATYGVRMQYPSDWTVQSSYPPDGFVGFMSPLQDGSDVFDDYFTIGVQDMPTVQVTEESLPDYVDSIINKYNTNEVKAIVYSNNTSDIPESLSKFRYPAYQTEYTEERYAVGSGNLTDFTAPTTDYKHMELWTIFGNKLYNLKFNAEPGSYDRFLPAVLDMIGSFEIINGPENALPQNSQNIANMPVPVPGPGELNPFPPP
jgi:hypothetical protein